MRFEFSTAGRILFGPGSLAAELPGALRGQAVRRLLIVHGANPQRANPLVDIAAAIGIHCIRFPVPCEPTAAIVTDGVRLAREAACDGVIGFGGGSAIDAAKAIAALAPNHGDLLDYLEVIGRAQPLTKPPLPWIAIPTTSGAGTEVTRNAVIISPADRVKVSLRSPLLLARVAIIDPDLTRYLPPAITATTGLDALTQLIEPYVCTRANPMTDGLCLEGIRRIARSLRRAFDNGPADPAAREDMALASLFGGLALANAGLGAVHGFAAPIGGMFPLAPHGAVCAALLPHVMLINLRALRQRDPGSPILPRYDQVARILTGSQSASAGDGATWIADLCAALHIPKLGFHRITTADIPLLVQNASRASSMKPNPIALTPGELTEILHAAI
jgi:alcohol dehydrogenase class IV